MSSYIYLELDTTPPNIEIYAPNYTVKNVNTEITVNANEYLSSFQDIYIIDSIGKRHNFTFIKRGNKYIGDLNFADIPYGIATIYARVYDTVGNISNIATHSINVISSLNKNVLTLEVFSDIFSFDYFMEKRYGVDTEYKKHNINGFIKNRKLDTRSINRLINAYIRGGGSSE